MNNKMTLNGGKRNRSVRNESKSKKLIRFSKIILFFCLIFIVFIFAEIKFGNFFKLNENKPIENSNNIEKEPIKESPQDPKYDNLSENNITNKVEDYAQYTVCDVEAPKKRTDNEIYSELSKMAFNNEEIKNIYKYKESYPINLLGSLVNNPEMTQFVSGYLASNGIASRDFDADDLNKKNKLILQWDKRWGYESYGNSIIAVSGCAPTTLSMVISQLTEGPAITPYDVAKFSESKGYYEKGFGTNWKLMVDAATEYGILAQDTSSKVASMKNKLDEGQLVIATMDPGDFTAEGHFIVVYGYNESGFLVNDPNCVYRSNKSWEFNTLSAQIRNAWAYKKK